MDKTLYTVSEVSRLAKVTVRTLHHYDEIGLLAPVGRTDAGYRLYCQTDLERLHQILLLRELGFALDAIGSMFDEPASGRQQAFLAQRELVAEQLRRNEAVLGALDAALQTLEGGTPMDPKTMFDGFDPVAHEQEVKERWGDGEAYKESARRTQRYSKEDWARYKAETELLGAELKHLVTSGAAPADQAAMDLAEKFRLQIDRWFYPCNHAMHARLADLYEADSRFGAYYEKLAPGATTFHAQAIRANARRRTGGHD